MKKLALALVVPLVLLLLALTACSGDNSGDKDDEKPSAGGSADVLAAAKKALDDTPGVHLVLESEDLPDGVDGVVQGEGVLTHQPGFDGTFKTQFSNISADVDIVAVDGKVWADVSLLPGGLTEVDPAALGVPDPAVLADPEDGISSWLTSVADPADQGKTRDGDLVLTTYAGTLPGAVVKRTIPTADGDGVFDASFAIGDDGRLHSAEVTGPFYSGEQDMTYRITLSSYDTTTTVTAP